MMPTLSGETAGTETNPPDVPVLFGMEEKKPGLLAVLDFVPGRGGGCRAHGPALIKHPF